MVEDMPTEHPADKRPGQGTDPSPNPTLPLPYPYPQPEPNPNPNQVSHSMNDVDTELRITIDGNQHVGLSFFTCHSPNVPGADHEGLDRGWRRQLKHDLATSNRTHNCEDPPTCSYCQGAYFNSVDFCDGDGDGDGDINGTAACYCACGMTDYCLNNTASRSPSPPPPVPPPPSPPPPSPPVCEAPLLHGVIKNLEPGPHTVTLEYKVASGTAYFGGAGSIARRLSVQARLPSRPMPRYSPTYLLASPTGYY